MTNMAFYGYHGVYPEERRLGQRFYADVDMYLDLAGAAESDDLKQSVDYGVVYQVVKSVVEGTPAQLIERVAGQICKQILSRFTLVSRVVVEVRKPSAPIPGEFDTVSVRLDRSRSSYE